MLVFCHAWNSKLIEILKLIKKIITRNQLNLAENRTSFGDETYAIKFCRLNFRLPVSGMNNSR